MTPASKKQIGFIKSLQSRQGLDDQTYRSMLQQLTGCTSATQLTVKQAVDVINHLNGGQQSKSKNRRRPRSSKAYVRRAYVVWRLLKEAGVVHTNGLNAFCKRTAGVDNVEWLDAAQGNKVNEALKAIAKREGVNIDRQR